VTELHRTTNETRIRLMLARGAGRASVATSVPFLDHMLVTFARYSSLDLTVEAQGDLKHHLIEDVAIVLGAALRELLPPTVARYGDRTLPMDDALVQVTLDLGGRAFYEGPLPSSYYEHFMQSFATHAAATLHVRVHRGRDRHHIVEAAFKALGLAVRDALVESGAVFSTKGAVALSKGGRGDGARSPNADSSATTPGAAGVPAGAELASADREPQPISSTAAAADPALPSAPNTRANGEPVVVTGSPRSTRGPRAEREERG